MTTHRWPATGLYGDGIVPCCGRSLDDPAALPDGDTVCMHPDQEHVDCPGPRQGTTAPAPNAAVGATTGGVVHAHAPGQVTCWISGCTGTSDDADPASGSYSPAVDRG